MRALPIRENARRCARESAPSRRTHLVIQHGRDRRTTAHICSRKPLGIQLHSTDELRRRRPNEDEKRCLRLALELLALQILQERLHVLPNDRNCGEKADADSGARKS